MVVQEGLPEKARHLHVHARPLWMNSVREIGPYATVGPNLRCLSYVRYAVRRILAFGLRGWHPAGVCECGDGR